MDLLNILLERALYDPEFRKPLPRQDGSAAARFALTSRAGALGQRLAELCRDPKVMEVLERFVADYRFSARRQRPAGGARDRARRPAAAAEDAPAWRVLAPGAKPVRRGTEWVLKTAQGVLPLAGAEVEAAGWLLARPDVAEPELRAAHPGIDAPAPCWRGCAMPAWSPPRDPGHPVRSRWPSCCCPPRPWPSRAPSPASAPNSWRMMSSPSLSPAAPPRRATPPAPTLRRRWRGRSVAGADVCVLGHAGAQEGGAQTGTQLAARRAGAVATLLAKEGVERDRIRAEARRSAYAQGVVPAERSVTVVLLPAQ